MAARPAAEPPCLQSPLCPSCPACTLLACFMQAYQAFGDHVCIPANYINKLESSYVQLSLLAQSSHLLAQSTARVWLGPRKAWPTGQFLNVCPDCRPRAVGTGPQETAGWQLLTACNAASHLPHSTMRRLPGAAESSKFPRACGLPSMRLLPFPGHQAPRQPSD